MSSKHRFKHCSSGMFSGLFGVSNGEKAELFRGNRHLVAHVGKSPTFNQLVRKVFNRFLYYERDCSVSHSLYELFE